MSVTDRRHTAGARPDSGRRIVEFGGGLTPADVTDATGHEHLAIRQQGRGVKSTRHREAAGSRPNSTFRMVQLRGRDLARSAATSCENLSVTEQGRGVPVALCPHAPGIAKVKRRRCRRRQHEDA